MKGFDRFRTTEYEEGADVVLAALEQAGFAVTYVRGHEISARLPKTAEELDAFDVVVLSDIGSNSFLIPDETFLRSERSPNKLTVLGDRVGGGGGTLARWPSVLGFDRVVAKPGATVVARAGEDPLLVVGGYGGSRVAAFTSDLAPPLGPAGVRGVGALCEPLDVDTVLGGPGRERFADGHAGVRRRPRLRRPLS
jgi:uncharacterized membrane protein